MKINPNLKVRNIVGESVVLLKAGNTSDMTRVLALNSTSLFLWNNLSGRDFDENDVVDLLLGNYDVSEEVATQDARRWVQQLSELGVFEA